MKFNNVCFATTLPWQLYFDFSLWYDLRIPTVKCGWHMGSADRLVGREGFLAILRYEEWCSPALVSTSLSRQMICRSKWHLERFDIFVTVQLIPTLDFYWNHMLKFRCECSVSMKILINNRLRRISRITAWFDLFSTNTTAAWAIIDIQLVGRQNETRMGVFFSACCIFVLSYPIFVIRIILLSVTQWCLERWMHTKSISRWITYMLDVKYSGHVIRDKCSKCSVDVVVVVGIMYLG